jgi:uncharacterized tellurite resistance protein B-like protein
MFGRARGFFSDKEESSELGSTGSDDLRLAVALLLISAAKSDGDFAEEEYRLIRAAAANKLSLPSEKIRTLLKQGQTEQLLIDEAVAEIKSHFDQDQRVQILALVWGVVSADEVADRDESAFAAKLRHDLGLSVEQGLRARKLAEDIIIDGFKEFVEASQTMVDGAQNWKADSTED